MKLNGFRFALAAGVVGAVGYAVMTLVTLIGVPGFEPFARLLEAGYGPYGYSLSWPGVVVGAGFGFLEAFVWVGAFAWLYNRLVSRETVLRPHDTTRDPARSAAPRQPQP